MFFLHLHFSLTLPSPSLDDQVVKMNFKAFVCLFVCCYKNQMRKEATVVVTTDKATKQTVISRTREEIVTSEEQRHISHEKVNTDVAYDCHILFKNLSPQRTSL